MYRINFGNGQVHGNFKSLAEAKCALVACCPDAFTRIQRHDGDGMWVSVKR